MEQAMHQARSGATEPAPSLGGTGRKRVEAVVETLARLQGRGETLAEVAHDARNMVTALGLYCDLLEEPGVLASPFAHYGSELRLVAAASRRLVEKLVALDENMDASRDANLGAHVGAQADPAPTGLRSLRTERNWRVDLHPACLVDNLAAELLANRNLLAAMAGPRIALTIDPVGCALPVRLTSEDLTRLMVNLVKNAAEAMPGGGRIEMGLYEQPAGADTAQSLLLTVEDNGPGIPEATLDRIFEAGYTTRTGENADNGWITMHRGLGLSITRSIVEAAGGRVRAVNRPSRGARFEIELPVFSR